ncbi:MAG: aminotransferase class V-fold PLP-dependent enzyme, partial [Synergistaceae bacterium]|nr:aminotransferase class V-fold PLP-dependent enzyme [Synergistaceae bacterium]
IARSRQQTAKAIGAESSEIFFTGSGTEADNWALKGVSSTYKNKGNHIITTAIEHHAVLHSAQFLEKNGFEVTYLPVDPMGRVSVDDVSNAVTDKTILVSVMFANNEIGTIQPIPEIGALCRSRGVIFHTDAVQAVAHVPIDAEKMNIDLLSLTAHKFHGPKGVGALYVRKGIKLENFVHGGGQENGHRAGTENTAGIIALGAAAEIACAEMEHEIKRISGLRDKLIGGVMKLVPHAKLNGAPGDGRLPNNANFSFIGVEGETLLLDLDAAGISASTGSACTSGSLDPSHVLMAMGLSHELAHGSLRLTLGKQNTEEDIDYVLGVLPEIIARRRGMSPVWDEYIKKQEG